MCPSCGEKYHRSVTGNIIHWTHVGARLGNTQCNVKTIDEWDRDTRTPKVVPCNHEDMNCPPGECDDLYPYSRPDMGR